MIIFNWLALIEFLISFAVGYVFSKLFSFFGVNGSSSDYIMTAFAGVTLILIDFILRFKKVKSTNGERHEIIFPKAGGHIFFIPAFVWGAIWFVLNISNLIG